MRELRRPPNPADTVYPGSDRRGATDEHVLDASGHFHVHDAPIDLSRYAFEAWIAFGFFWLLAVDIFYQFFTRYVMNDSAAWTEEIARYLLICTVFVAISAAVRSNGTSTSTSSTGCAASPSAACCRRSSTSCASSFFASRSWLTVADDAEDGQLQDDDRRSADERRLRGLHVRLRARAPRRSRSRSHWRQGYSLLERPDAMASV